MSDWSASPRLRSVHTVQGGCPYASSSAPEPSDPLPIYGSEFSANPHATYLKLRDRGPIAPVEIAPDVYGYITTTYQSAMYVLRGTPGDFAKDPNHWAALREGRVPPDSPAREMLKPRPNAQWMDDDPHDRLRTAITESLALGDTYALVPIVNHVADRLLDAVAPSGQIDLIADYAHQLPTWVLIEAFGCPASLSRRIVAGLEKMFHTADDAKEANHDLETDCLALINLKRDRPGEDITSRLLSHDANLTSEELVHQLILLFGAGSQLLTDTIGNTLKLFIDDQQFNGDFHCGVTTVREALDWVFWADSPVANYHPVYPRKKITYQGIVLGPGEPVLVSYAMANCDPALGKDSHDRAKRSGNRGHLAWGAGVHRCPSPARDMARLISETAVERVLSRFTDLALACSRAQLSRKPGTFFSSWSALPCQFTPTPSLGSSVCPPLTPQSEESTGQPSAPSAPSVRRRGWRVLSRRSGQ
ncbi:cytochrome P450 [Streptomyces sp. 110]|uniref:Cytochrome P450 n=1 Tax=Streptomyces endocoffeicus TaxID=2898945 RepID=A0ABS1PTR6_9ACTN|nr:cytochrome P450 [Streptomyces endocoffeicus]MBL1115312.1 cytochrome P450 [Streptomyces endocoffeicus]